jgi:MscS family membrane protein
MAQDGAPGSPPPASQPTTTQAARVDPLATPRSAMKELLIAVNEARDKPQRIRDAVACLDLSAIPPEEQAEKSPRLAEELARAVEKIIQQSGKKTDDLPEQSPDERVVFHAIETENPEGAVAVALVRGEDGCWRFAPDTVAAAPELLRSITQTQAETQTSSPPAAQADHSVPPQFRSARATMGTFLKAMNEQRLDDAAGCLDLSSLPEAVRRDEGRDRAGKLLGIMDRVRLVVTAEIRNDPAGEPFTFLVDELGRIEIAANEAGPRKGAWLFTTGTVESIPALYEAYEDRPRVAGLSEPAISFWAEPSRWIREQVPTDLKRKWFGLAQYQWIGLGLVLALGLAVHWIVSLLLRVAAGRALSTRNSVTNPRLLRTIMRPIGLLAMTAVWWLGLQALDLSLEIKQIVWPAMRFAMTALAVWGVYRLIDLVCGYYMNRAAASASRLDDVLIPLIRKTLKIVAVAVGLVVIIKALGVEQDTVNKLFAGLGIGGLAFALAAQDTVKNFFGSVTIILDRPFHVGDWIKVGDAEGTVEAVGLRSTRIRTFYNSEVTVPNSEMLNAVIDNLGRRRYRRTSTTLGVTYSTSPEQLEAFCEGMRELIRRHPYTRKDYYNVYVSAFADSSINVMLYCFHETPDWPTELRERQRLLLDIMRLARRLGVEFAFPTQTIHLADHHGDGNGITHKRRDGGERRSPGESERFPDPERLFRSTSGEPRHRGPRIPESTDAAMQFGREQASAVAKKPREGGDQKPPPVTFDRSA